MALIEMLEIEEILEAQIIGLRKTIKEMQGVFIFYPDSKAIEIQTTRVNALLALIDDAVKMQRGVTHVYWLTN